MMRTFLSTLVAVLVGFSAVVAVERAIVVVDAESGEPIPFANVGIPSAAVGTVADEDGRFHIDAPDPAAEIVVSAIGYETRPVKLDRVPDGDAIALRARPSSFREEITVTAPAPSDPVVLGHRMKERGFGFGFGSAMLGAELGARIRIARPTFVDSAHFTVTHTGGERFLYRVNIYDFADGEVGENLLTRNVLVEAEQQRGTLHVDLRDHALVVSDDVLLALEWIRDDAEVGSANVMFRAKPRTKSNLWVRLTSQMPMRRIDRHKLGFYLLGQPLKRPR